MLWLSTCLPVLSFYTVHRQICIYMCTHMGAWMHKYKSVHANAYAYMHTHIGMYGYAHVRVRGYTSTCAFSHVVDTLVPMCSSHEQGSCMHVYTSTSWTTCTCSHVFTPPNFVHMYLRTHTCHTHMYACIIHNFACNAYHIYMSSYVVHSFVYTYLCDVDIVVFYKSDFVCVTCLIYYRFFCAAFLCRV